jgi:hypothetical protein
MNGDTLLQWVHKSPTPYPKPWYWFCVPQVFATILAMITEEVNSFLMAARSGRAPLAMSGHILLLNWNAQVMVADLATR